MSRLTVSCPLAAIDCIHDQNLPAVILKEVKKVVEADCIKAVWFYPQAWPTKLKITFKEIELKNEVVMEGLCLFGKTVAFDDDGGVLQKIHVTDAHPEWDLSVLKSTFTEYGEIVRCEREFYYEDGKKTLIETGKIYVYVARLDKPIPKKIEILADNKLHPINVWYRKGNDSTVEPHAVPKCPYCGLSHLAESCPHKKRVCYYCQKDDHGQRECPMNKGTKMNESTLIFFNGKCPLSNWSTEYTFHVGKKEYCCVEQYVQEEKAYLFGDTRAAGQIRNETNPQAMKEIGNHIRNYNHVEWMDAVESITLKALMSKFSDPSAMGAKDFLVETGERALGEATMNKFWGTGTHHADPKALETWPGSNKLGNMLMEVRRRITIKVEEQNESQDEEKSASENEESENEEEKPSEEESSSDEESSNDEDSVHVEENMDEGNSSLEVSHLQETPLVAPTVVVSSPSPAAASATITSTPKPKKAKVEKWMVAIGDSNFPKDFEEKGVASNLQVKNLSKPGRKLKDAPQAAVNSKVPNAEVESVLLHLGTCEWHYGADIKKANQVFHDYKQMLNKVTDSFPNASFILSGIPIRNTTGETAAKARLINAEIEKLNKELEKLSQEQENIAFVSNDNIRTNEQGCNHHVEDTVHLNPEGAGILLGNLMKAIGESQQVSIPAAGEWSTVSK